MICGIRWIRLIYIREFKLEQVYNLWDYIMLQYKNNRNYEAVEDIALSMVIHLRPSLMKCKNNLDIIQKVQRYPEIKCSLPLVANSLKIHSKLPCSYNPNQTGNLSKRAKIIMKALKRKSAVSL
jgi:hypothetical protein